MSFDKSFEWILKTEGGLVEDPNDPGGLTNMGISHRSYPLVDIRNLTINAAKIIYKRDFWEKTLACKLPEPLDTVYFDTCVNQGPVAAVKMLQTALKVVPDGVVGSATLGAIEKMNQVDLIISFLAVRGVRYGQTKNFDIYGKGWLKRLFHLMNFIDI